MASLPIFAIPVGKGQNGEQVLQIVNAAPAAQQQQAVLLQSGAQPIALQLPIQPPTQGTANQPQLPQMVKPANAAFHQLALPLNALAVAQQVPAVKPFCIRVRKCHNVPQFAVDDVKRVRREVAEAGLALEMNHCWPQVVGNKKTGTPKKIDWSSMIVRILSTKLDADEALAALKKLNSFSSFDVSVTLEFDLWRSATDVPADAISIVPAVSRTASVRSSASSDDGSTSDVETTPANTSFTGSLNSSGPLLPIPTAFEAPAKPAVDPMGTALLQPNAFLFDGALYHQH